MSQKINYGNLMHNAMRGLIQSILIDIAKNGLPGAHHFFITFDTTHPDVKIAKWLSERYPSEMTIVIQHWFDNLIVTDVGFSITLNFGDMPEPLVIPFDSLRTFVDPSVEFGLRFDQQEDNEAQEEDEVLDEPDNGPAPKFEGAKVVSLDKFRK
ncbi:MAG: hypothetical protein ACI9O0_000877 [Paracoccaceae bacterium]|jgi:hypothetical protein